jgi:uncharacterized protein YndB with AHSA1/START domain
MANPLKMLKLKPQSVQFILDVPIAAPPKKVWSTLVDPSQWFYFDPARRGKHSLEVKAGGQWTVENPDGSSALFGHITYLEPGKLIRVSGQLPLSHLAVTGVIIFELQRGKSEKETLFRVGTRMFGHMDPDVKKRFKGGWKQLFGQLKEQAEK